MLALTSSGADFNLYVALTASAERDCKMVVIIRKTFISEEKRQSFEINYNSDNYEVLLIAS